MTVDLIDHGQIVVCPLAFAPVNLVHPNGLHPFELPMRQAPVHEPLHRTINALASELARRVYQGNDLGPRSQGAFVVDDTSQARAGRKVEGTSCYFDHTEGRTRKGHQVLHLGLAAEKGFLPLEA